MDRYIELIDLFSQFRQNGMSCRHDIDIRTDHRIVSDINFPVIYKGQIKISIYIFPHMHMISAPISMERRLQINTLSDLGKHFFQQPFPLFLLRRPGMIIIV